MPGQARKRYGSVTEVKPGRFARRIALLVGAATVLLFALIGVLSLTRGTPINRVLAVGDPTGIPAVSDSLFARSVQLYTGAHLSARNRIDLLLNGNGTYPILWRELRAAQRTITAQLYYSQPGGVADTLAAILAERARAGVRVLLLLDAFGSQNLGDAWSAGLRRSGVELEHLRPVRWYTLNKANNRSHVRAVVIDGTVGYTGGFGLADYWLGGGHADGEWRETNIRVEGPEVPQLQAAFTAAWAEATGKLLTGDLFFPPLSFEPRGNVTAAMLHTAPTMGSTPAERLLAISVVSARKRLYVTNSYFLPDDDFRAFLVARARAGVDVRVLTASTKTDIKSVYYAGRARYQELLEGGVRIYEYQPTMIHAKTFVVDGMWSAIGSMNFDNRSLSLNDEINVLVLDRGVGAAMDSLFLDDLRYSREITMPGFARRPWYERVFEQATNLVSRVL